MHIRDAEIEWYRAHGKHPDRITKEAVRPFHPYVIGDHSWNAANPDRKEFIEAYMSNDLPPCECEKCRARR